LLDEKTTEMEKLEHLRCLVDFMDTDLGPNSKSAETSRIVRSKELTSLTCGTCFLLGRL